MEFNDLFLRYVAAAWDKQMALGDIIDARDWQFDMSAGILSFGDDLRYRIQIIGTESTLSHTWLWAWANDASGIPSTLLQAARQLKALGEQIRVAELTRPRLSLSDSLNGHVLSMIASGVCEARAYYRCPYDNGAAFVLIDDPAFTTPVYNPTQRVSTQFPQLISNIPIDNHRMAFIHYLAFYNLKADITPETVTGQAADGQIITAAFDSDNRLHHLRLSVS